jgi:hypothetical protein
MALNTEIASSVSMRRALRIVRRRGRARAPRPRSVRVRLCPCAINAVGASRSPRTGAAGALSVPQTGAALCGTAGRLRERSRAGSMKCARSNATFHRTLRVTGAADVVDLPRADKREFRPPYRLLPLLSECKHLFRPHCERAS